MSDASSAFVPNAQEPYYEPQANERQLTFRALAAGCIVGTLVCTINVSFGLRTGWAIGGSILSAVLSFAMLSSLIKALRSAPLTALETNIAQTTGSAAGAITSTAGLTNAIPAMAMLGHEYSGIQLALWAASVGTIGVFYAVPLRRQMVLIDQLRFPQGTATAATIIAMFSEGDQARRQARLFGITAVAAAAFLLLSKAVPVVHEPPVHEWLGNSLLTTAAAYGFSLYISPIFTGAGILVGLRISASMVAGALLGWGFLASYVTDAGWVTGPVMSSTDGARGWILWPAVGMMTGEGLTALALNWRMAVRAFAGSSGDEGIPDRAPPSENVSGRTWMGGLAIATLTTTITAWFLFDMHPFLTPLAVFISAFLAAIATRTLGETEINPVGPMGKVTQLAYGAIAQGQIATNLMAASITSAGASQAADMMQDLKTGHLLGASPLKQFRAQLVGIAVGIAVCIPIYLVTISQNELGGSELPAPAAVAWKAVAVLLNTGLDSLPAGASTALLVGFLMGCASPIARKLLPSNVATFVPSSIAAGIAMIVPAYYSIAFFMGAIVDRIWATLQPTRPAGFAFVAAAGLMAGDGLTEAALNIAKATGILGS